MCRLMQGLGNSPKESCIGRVQLLSHANGQVRKTTFDQQLQIIKLRLTRHTACETAEPFYTLPYLVLCTIIGRPVAYVPGLPAVDILNIIRKGAAAKRPFAAISAATNYLYFLVFIDR